MKPLRWRALAREDADQAAAWYALRGGLDLELAFIEALETAVTLIATHPGTGSTRHSGLFPELETPLRFVPLNRFQRYLVYYLEFPDHVEILRVWDAARDVPDNIQDP